MKKITRCFNIVRRRLSRKRRQRYILEERLSDHPPMDPKCLSIIYDRALGLSWLHLLNSKHQSIPSYLPSRIAQCLKEALQE